MRWMPCCGVTVPEPLRGFENRASKLPAVPLRLIGSLYEQCWPAIHPVQPRQYPAHRVNCCKRRRRTDEGDLLEPRALAADERRSLGELTSAPGNRELGIASGRTEQPVRAVDLFARDAALANCMSQSLNDLFLSEARDMFCAPENVSFLGHRVTGDACSIEGFCECVCRFLGELSPVPFAGDFLREVKTDLNGRVRRVRLAAAGSAHPGDCEQGKVRYALHSRGTR